MDPAVVGTSRAGLVTLALVRTSMAADATAGPRRVASRRVGMVGVVAVVATTALFGGPR